MKTYWHIPGPKQACPTHCWAFYKYDGSNLRFEWSRRHGWYKFGTRYTVFDRVPEVVYEGPFTAEFVEGVRQGRYPVREGVVAKGIALGKKQNPQHGLWMAKVKTRWWLAELRRRAAESDVFRQALEENLREQGCEAA